MRFLGFDPVPQLCAAIPDNINASDMPMIFLDKLHFQVYAAPQYLLLLIRVI